MTKALNLRRILIVSLALITVFAFMPVQSDAATGKYRLVKKVTREYYNGSKWQKDWTQTFTYNKKGDPTSIKWVSYDENGKVVNKSTNKNKYTYKNGVRKTRTLKVADDSVKTTRKWTYDKYGHAKSFKYKSTYDGKTNSVTITTSFTKKGYLKTSKEVQKFDGDSQTFNFKYKTTLKNGLPKKIVTSSKNNGSWEKSYTYTFNKKGLLIKGVSPYGDYPTTYKYKMKNGRATMVTKSTKYKFDDMTQVIKERYKITYTTKKTDKVRYARMINGITFDADSTSVLAWY